MAKKVEVKAVNEKTEKAVKDIAENYSALVLKTEEFEFIMDTYSLMKIGVVSVRDVEKAISSVSGNAPTIRKSHAQYFGIAVAILDSIPTATDEKSVSDVLKMAARAGKANGVEKAISEIGKIATWQELEKVAPTAPNTSGKTNAKSSNISNLTLEEVLAGAIQALKKVTNGNIASAKTSDLKNAKALAEIAVTIAKNSGAIKVKESANA